jgi:hypothetical protein
VRSVLLEQLQTPASDHARDVARLRHEAETEPLSALPGVVERALTLADTLCWDSLGEGDAEAFAAQAAASHALSEFAECAHLRK